VNALPRITVLSFFALGACSSDRISGNSVETENTVAGREIRVDSLLPEWNRPVSGATVATLRLDARNFDFRSSTASGRDIRLERLDSTLLPFEIVQWDSASAHGRLRVRIDSPLLARGARFRLAWGHRLSNWTDPVKTWAGIKDSLRLSLTSVAVDDFERGTLRSLLPDSSDWYSAASDSCTVTYPSLSSAGHGRSGNAIRIGYSAPQQFFLYSLLGIRLGPGPRSLRSLDSLVFWARGSGVLAVAFDHLNGSSGPKAWKTKMPLDTGWTRIRIRPADLDTIDGVGNNVGWSAVRDSVTNLTFLANTGSELLIDDVRLHGIDRDDLR